MSVVISRIINACIILGGVIMLSVVMLSVVAPQKEAWEGERYEHGMQDQDLTLPVDNLTKVRAALTKILKNFLSAFLYTECRFIKATLSILRRAFTHRNPKYEFRS
jgi:hypothetical protein